MPIPDKPGWPVLGYRGGNDTIAQLFFCGLLKIQSSPKCKARGKFRSAAYGLYVSKKFFPQRSSWDEMWIFMAGFLGEQYGWA
ncbi:MAG: hypothetical protein HYU79_07105 [Nitrosomonadales bacterium]|nr:hypothetical protein [Nitrosomonadales bacterium]